MEEPETVSSIQEENVDDHQPEPANIGETTADNVLPECSSAVLPDVKDCSQAQDEEESNCEQQLVLMKPCSVVLNRQEVERYFAAKSSSSPKATKRRTETLTLEDNLTVNSKAKRHKTENVRVRSHSLLSSPKKKKAAFQSKASTTLVHEIKQIIDDSEEPNSSAVPQKSQKRHYKSESAKQKTGDKHYPTIKNAIQVLTRRLQLDHICFYCLERFMSDPVLKEHMFKAHKIQNCSSCSVDYIVDKKIKYNDLNKCALCMSIKGWSFTEQNRTHEYVPTPTIERVTLPQFRASTSKIEYVDVEDASDHSLHSETNYESNKTKTIPQELDAVDLSSAESDLDSDSFEESNTNESPAEPNICEISPEEFNIEENCDVKGTVELLPPIDLQKLCRQNSKQDRYSIIPEFNIKLEYVDGKLTEKSKTIYEKTIDIYKIIKYKQKHCTICARKKGFRNFHYHLSNCHSMYLNECALIVTNCQGVTQKCYNCGIEFDTILKLIKHLINCVKSYGIIPLQKLDVEDNSQIENQSNSSESKIICINCKESCDRSEIEVHVINCVTKVRLDVSTYHYPSTDPSNKLRCPICKNNLSRTLPELNGHLLKCNVVLGSLKGVLELKLCDLRTIKADISSTESKVIAVDSRNSNLGDFSKESEANSSPSKRNISTEITEQSTAIAEIDNSVETNIKIESGVKGTVEIVPPSELQKLCMQNSNYDRISIIPEFNVQVEYIDGKLTEESKSVYKTTLALYKILKSKHSCSICTRKKAIDNFHSHLSTYHRMYSNECALSVTNCQRVTQKCYNCGIEFDTSLKLIEHLISCVKSYGIIPLQKLDVEDNSQLENQSNSSESKIICINCKESCDRSEIEDHIINCVTKVKLDDSTYHYPSNDPSCKFRCPICKNICCINKHELSGHLLKCNAILGSLKGVLDLKLCDLGAVVLQDEQSESELSDANDSNQGPPPTNSSNNKPEQATKSNEQSTNNSSQQEQSTENVTKEPALSSSNQCQLSAEPSTKKQPLPTNPAMKRQLPSLSKEEEPAAKQNQSSPKLSTEKLLNAPNSSPKYCQQGKSDASLSKHKHHTASIAMGKRPFVKSAPKHTTRKRAKRSKLKATCASNPSKKIPSITISEPKEITHNSCTETQATANVSKNEDYNDSDSSNAIDDIMFELNEPDYSSPYQYLYDRYGDYRGNAYEPRPCSSRAVYDVYPDPLAPVKVCGCDTYHLNANMLKPKVSICRKCDNDYEASIFKWHKRSCKKKNSDSKIYLPYRAKRIARCPYCHIYFTDITFNLHKKDCGILFKRKMNNTMLFLKFRSIDIEILACKSHVIYRKFRILLVKIERHIELNHSITLIPMCSKCDDAFQKIDELVEHYLTHKEKLACRANTLYHYVPDNCHLEFYSVNDLIIHFSNKHHNYFIYGSINSKTQLVIYDNRVFTFLLDCSKCFRVTIYKLWDEDVAQILSSNNTDYMLCCQFCEPQQCASIYTKSSKEAQLEKFKEIRLCAKLRKLSNPREVLKEDSLVIPNNITEVINQSLSFSTDTEEVESKMYYPKNIIQTYGQENSLELILQNLNCSHCSTALLNEFLHLKTTYFRNHNVPLLFLCAQCDFKTFENLNELHNHYKTHH